MPVSAVLAYNSYIARRIIEVDGREVDVSYRDVRLGDNWKDGARCSIRIV
jgi:hypothetical protein